MEKLESEEKNMTTYDELVARGLIAQVTDEEEIRELAVSYTHLRAHETALDLV